MSESAGDLRGAAPQADTVAALVEPTTWERARGWRPTRRGLMVAGLLVLALIVLVVFAPKRTGYLDPTAVDPEGSRAVANVLGELGVAVVDATRFDQVLDRADGATVLITSAVLPNAERVDELLAANPQAIVLVGPLPGDALFDRLAVGVALADGVDDEPLRANCTLPAAVRAESASLPGWRYEATAWAGRAQACFDRPATAAVVALEPGPGRPEVVLLGSASPLTNAGLDTDGNAALALNLLGGERTLVWWRPSASDPALADDVPASLTSLLPPWVLPVLVQLVLGFAVIALWRARRLGRLVIEPLPVVVRAGETAAGHARLMHANRSRGEAAAQLRASARQRIAGRLGLPAGADPDRLVAAAAARTGRVPGEIGALLYGPEPADDEALVRLDHDVDALMLEVGGV